MAKQLISTIVPKHTAFNQLCRGLLLALTLLTLTACSGERSETLFSDYHSELAELLEEPAQRPTYPDLPRMPRASQVRDPIPEFSVSLLNSMRLDRCRVGQVLAQRNSSLGRAQSVSSQVYHEIDIIQALQECLNSSVAERNEDLKEVMTTGLEHKISTLPAWLDRFLTQSDAMRSALRPERSMLPQTPHPEKEATLEALRYFKRLFESLTANPKAWVDLEPFREHTRQLAQSDYLPQLWRTQQQLTGWLQEYNRMLTDGGRKLGCRPPNIPARADRVEPFIDENFTQSLEPLLNRFAAELTEVQQLLRALSQYTEQARWQTYMRELSETGEQVAHIELLQAEHSRLWQQTLRQCELSTDGW